MVCGLLGHERRKDLAVGQRSIQGHFGTDDIPQATSLVLPSRPNSRGALRMGLREFISQAPPLGDQLPGWSAPAPGLLPVFRNGCTRTGNVPPSTTSTGLFLAAREAKA